MSFYSKDSLEALRAKVDLAELIGGFIDLKRHGAAYKALCPFHDEKSPSFTVQKGDRHYHCFGCGAHGDAISFLMNQQGYSFSDAVSYLGERFHVPLEKIEPEETKGPSRTLMREALSIAGRLYHALLLHTEEGHKALKYLYGRGITLDFIKKFEIGFALEKPGVLHEVFKAKGISEEIGEAVGLIKGRREFFLDRILFPIRSPSGSIIGFSGRKFKEDTFGGKYVNTPETPLFKKSRVLFGLNYSRAKITKERRALVVEGQIDALKLIDEGLDFVVAGQGTAFGESHVEELINLGILKVFLAFDADIAGQNAAAKVGDLFQKSGVEVRIVKMPSGYDPDQLLREMGKAAFLELLEKTEDYLSFLVSYHGKSLNKESPAGKAELARMLSAQIRAWNNPLMVHESLKMLASLLKVPESMIGVGQPEVSNYYLKKSDFAGHQEIDPDMIIETDVLRFLIQGASIKPALYALAKANLSPFDFKLPVTKKLYQLCLEKESQGLPIDLLDVMCSFEEGEGQKLFSMLTDRKIFFDKAEKYFIDALQALLDRNWIAKRDAIHSEAQKGGHTDEEALALAKEFESIKRSPPKVKPCNKT